MPFPILVPELSLPRPSRQRGHQARNGKWLTHCRRQYPVHLDRHDSHSFALRAGLHEPNGSICVSSICSQLISESDQKGFAQLEVLHSCHLCSLASTLSVLTSLRSTASLTLSNASGPKPFRQLRGSRHKVRRLLGWKTLRIGTAVLALITSRSLDSWLTQ